jgi:micrococcal nuclease
MLSALFLATVIGISDGDTLIVLDEKKQQISIRLSGIDAPEARQPFGMKSKQSLSELCFGKQAQIKPQVKDRYGRTAARVTCDGVDANAEQITRGMAWVYRKNAMDPNLYVLQHHAKAAGRGLWSAHSPMPPWEWRKSVRHAAIHSFCYA